MTLYSCRITGFWCYAQLLVMIVSVGGLSLLIYVFKLGFVTGPRFRGAGTK